MQVAPAIGADIENLRVADIADAGDPTHLDRPVHHGSASSQGLQAQPDFTGTEYDDGEVCVRFGILGPLDVGRETQHECGLHGILRMHVARDGGTVHIAAHRPLNIITFRRSRRFNYGLHLASAKTLLSIFTPEGAGYSRCASCSRLTPRTDSSQASDTRSA